MKRLTINVGFITNSSSAIHWFDKKVLEAPEVKAFLEAYAINGYVGNVWERSRCDTFAPDRKTKEQLVEAFSQEPEWHAPGINPGDDDVVVIYGDEYDSLTKTLCELLASVARRNSVRHSSDEYN